MVDCDVERLPRGFFNGPRWVSLNSVLDISKVSQYTDRYKLLLFVKFHDMMVEGYAAGLGEKLRWWSSRRRYQLANGPVYTR